MLLNPGGGCLRSSSLPSLKENSSFVGLFSSRAGTTPSDDAGTRHQDIVQRGDPPRPSCSARCMSLPSLRPHQPPQAETRQQKTHICPTDIVIPTLKSALPPTPPGLLMVSQSAGSSCWHSRCKSSREKSLAGWSCEGTIRHLPVPIMKSTGGPIMRPCARDTGQTIAPFDNAVFIRQKNTPSPALFKIIPATPRIAGVWTFTRYNPEKARPVEVPGLHSGLMARLTH